MNLRNPAFTSGFLWEKSLNKLVYDFAFIILKTIRKWMKNEKNKFNDCNDFGITFWIN